MRLAVVLAVPLCLGASVPLFAQCPDGTPPPCRGSTSAAAAPVRRPNPPLDDRTWIILPFENVARVPDIDWLKDASVNLLYLDMSKWRDIRVIDDERVADLIREVPEARAGLTLQSGLAVARRAGAGKLVMGDLLKVGNNTQVVAKIYDVRSGNRVRNVREQTATADSLMSLFGRLARGILNADAPTGAALGIGTSRLDAYQAYLAGVQALNAFDITGAQPHFEEALRLDSTFALAHYKLSIVLGWSNSNAPAHRAHAEAAQRLGATLPPRERTLIAAQAQSAAGDYGRSCQTLAPLVQADSSDVEALYNYGECQYHDAAVIPVPGDTAHFMFRGSYNASMRAFRRVLVLDPTYHLAFAHIQDALQAFNRQGCPLGTNGMPSCDNGQTFMSVVRRSGDSLVTVPVRLLNEGAALRAQVDAAARDGSYRRNLEEAARAAQEWLAAGPTESRANMAFGRAQLRLGRINEAAAAFAQVTPGQASRVEATQFILDRFEVALKLDHPDEARRLVDSAVTAGGNVTGGAGLLLLGIANSMVGRMGRMDTAATVFVQGPPAIKTYFRSEFRAVLGVPDDSLFLREDSVKSLLASANQSNAVAIRVFSNTMIYAMQRRTSPAMWPATDTANADSRIALVSLLAMGDTARFRRALAGFDSSLATRREQPDQGEAFVSAEAHLLLRDSAGALATLRAFRDVTWRMTPIPGNLGNGLGQVGMLWPRMFLMLGDLEASAGNSAAAATAYRRVIGWWDHGDPVVQPAVEHARAGLARVGG